MDEDYLATLWHEFFAEEGSFLLQLRVQLRWDKVAFERLTEAMRACCKRYQHEQRTEEQRLHALEMRLPRWLAMGFWFIPEFVRDWTSHPAWEQEIAREPAYFKHAYERLHLLAVWFFEGHSYRDDEEKG